MSTLASAVMDRVRACLNDVAIDLYSNTVILPYLKMANDDLADELMDVGATVQKAVSADLSVSANSPTVTLPADIITPIELFEKNVGEPDSSFILMTQRNFTPNDGAGFWEWREQAINFNPFTVDKVIRLRYNRVISEITGDSSPIEIPFALNYLAHHTAALVAEYIAQNTSKAAILEGQAEIKLNKLLKREVKQNQSQPVRRRGFRLKSRRFV